MATLENVLGQSIGQICPNHFHDPDSNHCAHFVSHMLGFGFSYNCVDFKGGTGPAANIRVHEIFERCPTVGVFADAAPDEDQLIFVTKESAVDPLKKRMINLPNKHVGIYCGGRVYHYSNTQNAVVKCAVDEYLATFETLYCGPQGLFFGSFPQPNNRQLPD